MNIRLQQGINLILILVTSVTVVAEQDYSVKRVQMVTEIRQMAKDTAAYTGIEKFSGQVITAMQTVPRHEFVPLKFRSYSYRNHPLPIGNDQTISQPYIVALMTELAAIDNSSHVLEIGTGSGYQAAVLSVIAKQVYTIEIIADLGNRAKETLAAQGYNNVEVKIGDGYAGWPEHAPFDAILVTAAPETVPQPLINQLKTGGRMVIPVGKQNEAQSLQVLVKQADGTIRKNDVLPVGFVPLTREQE